MRVLAHSTTHVVEIRKQTTHVVEIRKQTTHVVEMVRSESSLFCSSHNGAMRQVWRDEPCDCPVPSKGQGPVPCLWQTRPQGEAPHRTELSLGLWPTSSGHDY